MGFPALPVGRLPSWIEDCGFGGSTMQKPLTIADVQGGRIEIGGDLPRNTSERRKLFQDAVVITTVVVAG